MLPQADEFFRGVLGRTCWSVIAGAGSGSVVSLNFGEKVRRKHPIKNAKLSLEERLFEAERSLLVYCDWRLALDRAIVCSSQSIGVDGHLDVSVLTQLIEQRVSGISFSSSFHDLSVQFEKGHVFAAFCNVGQDNESNYVMFNPSNLVFTTPDGSLAAENISD